MITAIDEETPSLRFPYTNDPILFSAQSVTLASTCPYHNFRQKDISIDLRHQ